MGILWTMDTDTVQSVDTDEHTLDHEYTDTAQSVSTDTARNVRTNGYTLAHE